MRNVPAEPTLKNHSSEVLPRLECSLQMNMPSKEIIRMAGPSS